MVSKMAMEDVRALEKKGVRLSFEDIVKLNALGVKCESSDQSSQFFNLPRCAFLGSDEKMVVFREPTISQSIWFENALRMFNEDDGTTLFLLRAYSMLDGVELPRWNDLDGVRDALKKFLVETIAPFTTRQVLACIDYCLYGDNADDGETPEKPHEERSDDEDDGIDERFSVEIGVIHKAQALRLGISLSDMMKMTKSGLCAVIDHALQHDGQETFKQKRNDAIGAYYSTLESIKQKHEQEVKTT